MRRLTRVFGIGETEFIIILIFGFLLFGPDKLPGMGRTIGRVLRQFREASEGFTEVVQTNIVDPATQELNNTGSTKRKPAAAKAPEDDDDADIEETEAGEQPRKRETFAERKARLEAERKAREAQAQASSEDAEALAEADDDMDADEDLERPAAQVTRPVATESPKTAAQGEGEVPASPTVTDLYARGSRRSSRAKAQDATRAAKTEAQEEGPQGESSPDESDVTTENGEGAGNAEA